MPYVCVLLVVQNHHNLVKNTLIVISPHANAQLTGSLCAYRDRVSFFGESGLLENEPTAPAVFCDVSTASPPLFDSLLRVPPLARVESIFLSVVLVLRVRVGTHVQYVYIR